MPVGSDRNLLFGMLALQMDFISRSALIEGMQAWLLDKSRSLGEILVERGALIAANRSLLEPLVEAHIKQHGGDARRSLAALSSDAGIGQDLQRIDDVEIRASIAALPKQSLFQAGALSSAAPINDQVAPSDPNAPPSEPAPLDPYRTQQYETNEPQLRYRVLRPHAEGGLGRIYVAIDQELNREVAFKEIRQDRVSSKEARDRFRIEAEITGGLEHPGIVPVYGLGHYADGRPFYAMRFIRGDSLLEAVRRFHRKDDSGRSMATSTQDFASSLPFRDMVKRLIDVCNAIQYAHDRGVLHRDLKPDNIMLGKYGETLVVDWGLAKAGNEQPKSNSNHSERPLVPVSGSAIDATQYGQALGTYGFMSPEQSEGKLDLLGPASDVYSLGATLYAILTGEAPLRSFGLAELLARLRKGDIPAPRSIQSKTPRPLEAVCQKAMAVAPQDRFLSAKAMTEDLDAWLADQPVSAYREPILLRTRRWLRRHPVAVSTSSVALILTLVGLGLFSSLLAGKNSELATLNSELVSTNQRLDTSLQSEEKAREEAEQNADTARGQSQLAFSTMNVLITDLQGSLENLSGGATVRNAILQKLLPQLNKLSTDFVAKSAINRSSMRAMTELGESILQLGANSKAENSESKDSPSSVALRLFTQAFEIAKQLSEASPSDAQANRDISALHVKLGDVLLRMGQTSEALVHYEVGKELSQKLAEADPSDLKARKYLVGSLGRLGDIQLRLGKNRKAYAHFKDALKVGKKLVETEPNDAEMQRVLWVSHNKLGDVLLHSYDLLEWGQTKNALAHYELALNIIQKLAEADPEDAQAQRDLSASHQRLGDVLLELGRTQDAFVHYEDGLKVSQRIVAADPISSQAQQNLYLSQLNLADVLHRMGQSEKALLLYQDNLTVSQKLADADPRDTESQRKLSLSHERVGILLSRREAPEALAHYEDGLTILRKLAEADLNDLRAQRDLIIANLNVGNMLLQVGQSESAIVHGQEALKICQRLVDANKRDSEAQRFLYMSHRSMGDLLLGVGRLPEALEHCEIALKISKNRSAADPWDSEAQQDLLTSHNSLGDVLRKMENAKDSLAQFEEGLQISQKLAETDARNAEAQRDLAGSHTKLGLVHRELKHMEDAKRSFQAGIDVLVRMIDAGQFVKQCEDEKKELEAELVKCNYTAE